MKFLRKCLLFFVLVSLCLALYLLLPNVGYIDTVFLDYKFHSDIYVFACALIVFVFLKSIVKNLIKVIKGFCKRSDKKRENNSIQNLARFIASKGLCEEKNIDDKFSLCKIAVIVNNGTPVSCKTGIEEIDVHNLKNEILLSLQTKNLDKAISLVNNIVNDFPQQLSIIQNELLQIAVTAVTENKTFEFDPTRSKYKLSRDFIAKYNVTVGLVVAEQTTDISTKLKILEDLYKSYNDNTDVAWQLLSILTNDSDNKKKALKLIEKIFKIKPDRNLVSIFLKICTTSNIFEEAENLLKQIPDNNTEKIWFLLVVAVELKLYSKIVELVKILTKNNTNQNELCVFFVKNYAIMSLSDEVVELICR